MGAFFVLPFLFPVVFAGSQRSSSIWITRLDFAARSASGSSRAKYQEERPMPNRPKKPCAHPACPELVENGQKYCEKHRTLHPEETRSASSRGYGRSWQHVSRQFLAAHPLCTRCLAEGRYRKATVVDHIVPHCGDTTLFWDRGNWQPLCKSCHDLKTGTQDRKPTYHY